MQTSSVLKELNIAPGVARRYAKELLDWYNTEGRAFPWRETKDPYSILVAEVLLQRTRAQKVAEIFPAFIGDFPDPKSLARASARKIANAIAPLGIAYRAGRLKNIAQVILEEYDGRVPDKRNELTNIPGIGDYTANAVLCFAYGYRLPVVDPTVARVFERVFDFHSQKAKPTTDKKLWQLAEELLPVHRFREYNFALLDLGALICVANNPKHAICPISDICRYYLRVEESTA